jgi:hypothetical protein
VKILNVVLLALLALGAFGGCVVRGYVPRPVVVVEPAPVYVAPPVVIVEPYYYYSPYYCYGCYHGWHEGRYGYHRWR